MIAGIPPDLVGVWRRDGIGFDGVAPVESADVWWVQAGRHFVDIRVPYDPAGAVIAFAGEVASRGLGPWPERGATAVGTPPDDVGSVSAGRHIPG